MRLFCVKMQQHDWFRLGHSDWLLGWGRFGPFGVMWSDCGQDLVTWLRQWRLSCAKNINPLCAGGSIFGDIKWRNNIKDFALLNKNMVVVFNLTMFGGIGDALCIGNVCLDFIIPPASTKLIGGYTGITLSVCPSVRLWTESCPLCIFNNTHRIHFIFAHLIKQLQKVCRV